MNHYEIAINKKQQPVNHTQQTMILNNDLPPPLPPSLSRSVSLALSLSLSLSIFLSLATSDPKPSPGRFSSNRTSGFIPGTSGAESREAVNPTPYTLNPAPYTLNPTPYILNPQSYTLDSTPYTMHHTS